MNKDAYLQRLTTLLADLSPAEREEAVQYYKDYIEDAGVDNESSVLQELGSPELLADEIKRGLGFKTNETTESEELNFTKPEVSKKQNSAYKFTGWQLVLLITLIVLSSPIWFSVAATILSFIFGIIVTIFTIIIVTGILGITFLIAFIILFVLGIIKLFMSPVIACFFIGLGCFLGGLGIFSLILCSLICTRFLPWAFRLIMRLFHYISNREGRSLNA